MSYQIGCRKPNKKIYEYVIEDLKCDANNILFIDDDISNIAMANKYGWNTCQAYGYELEKIKENIEKFLRKDDESEIKK